jgi:hypothetical protein
MSSSAHCSLLHKRSSEPEKVPLLSSVFVGELSLNVHDGTIFTKTIRDTIERFSCDSKKPYILNSSLSGTNFQFGGNSIQESFAAILGGYNNTNSGAGSTVINGENNDINQSDFCLIGAGINNTIGVSGALSVILGGENNYINHQNCFTLGSNLTSHADNFTYVDNISGAFWGDGKHLTNVPILTSVPLSSTAPGVPGHISYDTHHLYVCIAANTWKRIDFSSSNW